MAVDGKKSVHEAILDVIETLGPLQRRLEVGDVRATKNYEVIFLDDIVERLQPILVANKLLLFRTNVLEHTSWDAVRDGVTTHFSKAVCRYKAVGPDGSEEYFESVGESESPNDKSTAAALSFAEKYLYKDLFKIVTGDPDPDSVGSGVVKAGVIANSATPTPAASPAAPAPTTPQPTQTLATAVAATAGAGEEMATKPMQQAIWSISHKPTTNNPPCLGWDDVKTIEWLSQKLKRDFTGLSFNDVQATITKAEARKIIDALKALAGQK